MLDNYYRRLIDDDTEAIRKLFPGPPAVNSPLSGSVDGSRRLGRYVSEEGSWLRERNAQVRIVDSTENEKRSAVEFSIDLQTDHGSFDLPVAIVGQKAGDGYGQIRVYHSLWPINGKHIYRAPVVWPGETLDEPPVIRRYFRDLSEPDKDDVLTLFAEDAYVREPAGTSYRHTGPDGRRSFYGVALDSGPIGMTHTTITFDGRLCCVEYICDFWGKSTFDPMAGCAFYELTADQQKIRAVRIYDDVTSPGE